MPLGFCMAIGSPMQRFSKLFEFCSRWRRKPSSFGSCARAMAGSEEHTSELQSHLNLVCRLLLEKKKQISDLLSTSDTLRYRHLETAHKQAKCDTVRACTALCSPRAKHDLMHNTRSTAGVSARPT